MTLQEWYNLRYGGSFIQRVTASIAKLSLYIKQNGGVGGDPARYPAQLAWANQCLATGEATLAMAETMLWAVMESAAIQQAGAACLDSDIDWIVESKMPLFVPAL